MGTYWDSEWDRRIVNNKGVFMNTVKAKKLIDALWKNSIYVRMKKLEVGCGPAFHARSLNLVCPIWADKDHYLGIDRSERVTEFIDDLRVISGDFCELETDERFELFLFLDVLEHMEDHEAVASKVKELANEKYHIFGNIPLYQTDISKEGGFERPMNIRDLGIFLAMAGIKEDFYTEIYGIDGYPYMMFFGDNHEPK